MQITDGIAVVADANVPNSGVFSYTSMTNELILNIRKRGTPDYSCWWTPVYAN